MVVSVICKCKWGAIPEAIEKFVMTVMKVPEIIRIYSRDYMVV